MKLRVTLLRPTGPSEDILITADAAATVAEVAAAIVRNDPERTHPPEDPEAITLEILSTIAAGEGEILDRQTVISHAGVGNGSAIRVVTSGYEARPDIGRLHVTGGPDAGRSFPLTRGSFTIGRESSCEIVLTDPLVSKRHARIEIGVDRVELVDLNSANGILIGGSPVTRLEAASGRLEATLGDTRIVVSSDRPLAASAPIAAASVHQVDFVRSPRVEERFTGVEVEGTELPRPAKRSPFPWLALAAPLILGVVLFIVTGQPTTLIFVALSPVLMIGTWLTALLQNRREAAEQRARFMEQLERLERRLSIERDREIRVRSDEVPPLNDVCLAAVTAGPLIWTRRPEHWSFLHAQLGVGETTSRSTVANSANRDSATPESVERLDEVVSGFATVANVPILESLPLAGALGVVGPRATTGAYARALIAQIVGLHAPGDVVVTAIVGASWSEELAHIKWLPHAWEAEKVLGVFGVADNPAAAARVVAQLEELVASRGAERGAPPRLGALKDEAAATHAGSKVGVDDRASRSEAAPHPAVIVLIAADAHTDLGRLIQLSEDAAQRGVIPIWLVPDAGSLPAVCRTSVDLTSAGAVARFVRLGTVIEGMRTDALTVEQFGVFARSLARLTDAGDVERNTTDVPRTVALLHLLGREMATSADNVVDRWLQNESIPSRLPPGRGSRGPSKLRALVGQAADGAMHLDLRAQGPHALVGGTTGSGKSEFLQAWVIGMAAEYSPQRVTFLFVDYKGGSAFADCVSLPHCVGIVTDLNPHLVRRVLVSLRAELHHRERLFNRKKAKDILELEKRGDPDAPPALVLVIDEFAALAKEVPEFVDGVVDIAQRGRSLGIHLIMATQRPAGVIKDNLRANTNMRIALRMADESDSDDVIGTKQAALFDSGIPGRGIAKTGPGRVSMFQSAYTGGWSLAAPEAAMVEIASFDESGRTVWESPDPVGAERDGGNARGPNDQQLLVARVAEAAAGAGILPPRRPWLDELAPTFDQTKLQQRTDAQLVLGVVDVPEHQEQVPFFFLPDEEGHLAIFGTGGSGKSATLRTLAVSAGITPRGGPVHVYGVDFSAGGLKMLEPLPHVGSIIAGDDTERIARLFTTLAGELDRRGDAFAAVSAGSITEYRALAGRPDEPRIVVLIDGFATMRQEYEGVSGRAETFRTLQQVLSDGRSLGIHVALTADRVQSVPSALHAMIQRRIVLRMADVDGYGALDVPRDILDTNSVPGRAIVDKHEAQLAIIGGTRSIKEQSIAIERMAASMRRRGFSQASGIRSLPVLYGADELPAMIDERVIVGISDADLGPIGIDPAGTFLIAGPPGSGRSNALAAIASQARRARPNRPIFYIGNAGSPAASGLDWTDSATDPSKGMPMLAAILELIDSGDAPIIALEGIAEYSSSLLELKLGEVVRRAARGEALLIAEGELSEWSSNFGLLGDIKAARRGVVLQPETIDGELVLRTPFPRLVRGEFPSGRGILAQRGRIARVQFPMVLTPEGALHG